ncbi:hypothetical protein K505DRAFT_418774 [Melanomma pulvis-pyrius CBS 109.77]|uniref:Uncharacterized protein n=1 Tax=Melanomma pulvis-pyrius CBS 109.77 TaxID=1314802 RepID=A0A6A6X6H4_9PLEO|nr:hypothetical protein K505DRAFT_418774 [Melanomma pulvis-pyrius CBS 109.77]
MTYRLVTPLNDSTDEPLGHQAGELDFTVVGLRVAYEREPTVPWPTGDQRRHELYPAVEESFGDRRNNIYYRIDSECDVGVGDNSPTAEAKLHTHCLPDGSKERETSMPPTYKNASAAALASGAVGRSFAKEIRGEVKEFSPLTKRKVIWLQQ